MNEAGWYADYEDPTRLRYHDGERWTEHVHERSDEVQGASTAPSDPASPSDGDDAQKQEPAWLKVVAFPLFGIFAGIIVGGLVFNAMGSLTPVTEHDGTVSRIEIEYSTSSSTRNRESHALLGTTAEGAEWKIYDQDAYNVLRREGYPQPVRVAIGDWTDTAERVIGANFEVDHQTTAGRVGWSVAAILVAVGALATTWAIARNQNAGRVAAALFFVFMAVPGAWLGFQTFQWVQSG